MMSADMTTVIATLEFKDFAAAITGLVLISVGAIFAGVLSATRDKRSYEKLKLLARQMHEIQRKVDALLKHEGIKMPPPPASLMSPEVEQLAKDPKTKIAAIALYREENPGMDLREAKELIEAIYKNKK